MAKIAKIERFGFQPGERIGWKYEIIEILGAGWEGEVYRIREVETGIERAAKFFFPQRNIQNRAFKFYAKKLHRLRHCSVLIQYHTQETVFVQGQRITFLVSEYVEGLRLVEFLERQPGGRLTTFQALHLLYSLASGLEPIHLLREYHGDLHTENVIVHRYGLRFDLKILDFFHYGKATGQHLLDDVCDMIRIFYDAMGGERYYAQQAPEIKSICCGLKRTLIQSKYRTAGQLRSHLENLTWRIPEKKTR